MDYVRAVDDYLSRPEFRYVERPRAAARRRPAAGLLPQREPSGLLPALRGRDGAAAADGRHLGPRGDRVQPRRLLVAQGRLDRARHRRPRVGRGLVRQVRLGHDRSHAGRDPGAQPGRRARARRGRTPSRRPTPAPATPPANTERPNLSLRPGAAARARRRDQRGLRRRWLPVLGLGAAASLGGLALVLAVLLFLRRPRGKTPMDRAIAEVEDALRRVGRPGHDRHDDDPARTPARLALPEVAAYLRALAAGRYAASPEPLPRTGRRALRRALAQGLGFGAGARAVGAAAADRARAPRSRTLDVETRVRA